MTEEIQKVAFDATQLDKEQITKWIQKDIESALALLQAINKEPAIKAAVTEHFYNQYLNLKVTEDDRSK